VRGLAWAFAVRMATGGPTKTRSAMNFDIPRRLALARQHVREIKVCAAFVVVWLVFDRLASALSSTRGEQGAIVCLVVLGPLLAFERLQGSGARGALRSLGIQRARKLPLLLALGMSLALFASLPVYAWLTGSGLEWRTGWPYLVFGMWLQGGVAEEALFRGFVFRHMRTGRTFWRAAWLAALPFTLVHLSLFVTLDAVVAGAALALALLLSFPLAWLFDRSAGSVWPGALLHAAVQAPIKVVEVNDAASFASLSVAWIGLCAALPWLVFLLPRHRQQ
jgi:membrane protease YdiL (CAAX protease family)